VRMRVQSLASLSGLRIWFCHKLWCSRRYGLNPELLWLWHRLVAIAPIWPLAWELAYAVGMAIKRKKKKDFKAARHEHEMPFAVLKHLSQKKFFSSAGLKYFLPKR